MIKGKKATLDVKASSRPLWAHAEISTSVNSWTIQDNNGRNVFHLLSPFWKWGQQTKNLSPRPEQHQPPRSSSERWWFWLCDKIRTGLFFERFSNVGRPMREPCPSSERDQMRLISFSFHVCISFRFIQLCPVHGHCQALWLACSRHQFERERKPSYCGTSASSPYIFDLKILQIKLNYQPCTKSTSHDCRFVVVVVWFAL